MQTDRDIQFNEFIQPITIERVNIPANEIATFAGFGASEESDLSWEFWTETMQFVNLKIIKELECANRVALLYKNGEISFLPYMMNQICTEAFNGAGICYGMKASIILFKNLIKFKNLGDSGSGLVVNGKLVGVASFILKTCPSGVPEFFTQMSSYSDWIDFHTENSSNKENSADFLKINFFLFCFWSFYVINKI